MRLLSVSFLLLASFCAVGQNAAPAQNSANDHPTTRAGHVIRAIKISKPSIEVTGSHLSRVEIWIEPTGTGVGVSLVGEAKRVTPAGRHEKWTFPISSLPGYPHPIMAVNAFAKAYDRKGKEVGRKSLGFNGVSEFNAALYGRVVD